MSVQAERLLKRGAGASVFLSTDEENKDGKQVGLCDSWLADAAPGLVILTVGTFFYALFEPEHISLFDALYMVIVTCSTVGYGDYSPSTPTGRAVGAVFMVLGTFSMGIGVSRALDRFLKAKEAELHAELIESTDFVRKADVNGDGKVSESEFILFKLQQLRKVDTAALQLISEQFKRIDADGSGFIEIGEEVAASFRTSKKKRTAAAVRMGGSMPQPRDGPPAARMSHR